MTKEIDRLRAIEVAANDFVDDEYTFHKTSNPKYKEDYIVLKNTRYPDTRMKLLMALNRTKVVSGNICCIVPLSEIKKTNR